MRALRKLLAKAMIRRAHRALRLLDAAMRSAGMNRGKRRRVWRDVISGHLDPADLLGG